MLYFDAILNDRILQVLPKDNDSTWPEDIGPESIICPNSCVYRTVPKIDLSKIKYDTGTYARNMFVTNDPNGNYNSRVVVDYDPNKGFGVDNNGDGKLYYYKYAIPADYNNLINI